MLADLDRAQVAQAVGVALAALGLVYWFVFRRKTWAAPAEPTLADSGADLALDERYREAEGQ